MQDLCKKSRLLTGYLELLLEQYLESKSMNLNDSSETETSIYGSMKTTAHIFIAFAEQLNNSLLLRLDKNFLINF